jgi:signal peptidase II
MNARNFWFTSTLAVGLLVDQVTKAWVVRNLEPHVDEIQIIDGWFSFVHAQNTGAAFSTMEGQLGLFLVFTVIAVIVVVHLVRQQPTDLRFVPMTLGLILSGALGNGVDRLRQGYVTDFLKVYAGHDPLRGWFIERFGTNVWPIFNVADSVLLVGVTLFALYWALQREGEVVDDEGDGAPELTS